MENLKITKYQWSIKSWFFEKYKQDQQTLSQTNQNKEGEPGWWWLTSAILATQ
jgi:hypothetical protein